MLLVLCATSFYENNITLHNTLFSAYTMDIIMSLKQKYLLLTFKWPLYLLLNDIFRKRRKILHAPRSFEYSHFI